MSHRRIKFDKKQFYKNDVYPAGWHLLNESMGQSGKFSICGIAHEGDGINALANPTVEEGGRVTCKDCLSVIAFCKQIVY